MIPTSSLILAWIRGPVEQEDRLHCAALQCIYVRYAIYMCAIYAIYGIYAKYAIYAVYAFLAHYVHRNVGGNGHQSSAPHLKRLPPSMRV